jgi:hypothetical protein
MKNHCKHKESPKKIKIGAEREGGEVGFFSIWKLALGTTALHL